MVKEKEELVKVLWRWSGSCWRVIGGVCGGQSGWLISLGLAKGYGIGWLPLVFRRKRKEKKVKEKE